MDIIIRELDESHLEYLNPFDEAFIVDSKLCLRAESGEITYTVVSVPSYEKRYPTDQVDYAVYLRHPDKAVFFAEMDGQIVGRIILRKNWNQYGCIEDLVVDAKYRKRGVGRRLITQAVEWAKAKNLPGILLETQNNNVGACRLYERCGFRLGGFDNYLYRGTNRETDEIALFWYLIF